MGRPRLHDDATLEALLDAAEGILEAEGPAALTVRRVAAQTGTTTRAVYSTCGSKDHLVVQLGVRAFDLLGKTVAALPVTDDPVADLVAAGAMGFRDFICRHPALFRLGFGHLGLHASSADIARAAEAALQHLQARVRRVQEGGGLGDRGLEQATMQFDAFCEGLAACDLRRQLPPSLWNDALTALVRGWAATN